MAPRKGSKAKKNDEVVSPKAGKKKGKDNKDTVVDMLQTIADRLSIIEDRQDTMEVQFNEPSPSGGRTKRRRKSQSEDISDQLRAEVTKRFKELKLTQEESDSDSEATDSEEERTPVRASKRKAKGKRLQSGRVLTANDKIKKSLTWPHEFIYNKDGTAAKYDELSLSQFVLGYTLIMEQQKPQLKSRMLRHLQQLMTDEPIYGWEVVRNFHAIWMQQLESKRARWGDDSTRADLRRTHVWNSKDMLYAGNSRTSSVANSSQSKSARNPTKVIPAPPGTKACVKYQIGECSNSQSHGTAQHVCAFCLKVVKRMCMHPEQDCKRKEWIQAEKEKN